MTPHQWKTLLRFMFWSITLLNRSSKTPKNEGNWSLELDLLREINNHPEV